MSTFSVALPAEPNQRFSPEAAAALVGHVVSVDVDGRPVGLYVVRMAETNEDGTVVTVSLSVKKV